MKKIAKAVLAGAIAFGAVGAVGTMLPTSKAEASQTTVTDWNGYKESQLQLSIDASLSDADRDYNYGDAYDVNMYVEWRKNPQHIKIYRVNSDGTLQRYKTLYPEYYGSDGTTYNYTFGTEITTAYPAGNYYAVHTYSYEYATENGPMIVTEADRSYRFTIN